MNKDLKLSAVAFINNALKIIQDNELKNNDFKFTEILKSQVIQIILLLRHLELSEIKYLNELLFILNTRDSLNEKECIIRDFLESYLKQKGCLD